MTMRVVAARHVPEVLREHCKCEADGPEKPRWCACIARSWTLWSLRGARGLSGAEGQDRSEYYLSSEFLALTRIWYRVCTVWEG